MTEYDEAVTKSSSLSLPDRQRSYSVLKSPDGLDERLVRVRLRQIGVGGTDSWEVLSATGIDRSLGLDEHVLYPGGNVTLSFLQDVDQDRLTAVLESMNNCRETSEKGTDGKFLTRDSDGDALDDRFEVMIGWEVDLHTRGKRTVHSRCSTKDSDGDGLLDNEEAPGVIKYDVDGLVLFDLGYAPYVLANAPKKDTSGDATLDYALSDPVTDPRSKDSDGDGLDDKFEVTPYRNALRPPNEPGTYTPVVVTSPEHADSDQDSVSDGLERTLGGNPRIADFSSIGDTDHDGLVSALEEFAYEVKVRRAHPRSTSVDDVCRNGACPTQTIDVRTVTSDPAKADTDGDGLLDAEERELTLDPRSVDTDADGLTDFEEVRGLKLRDLGTVKTDPLNADTDNDKRNDGEEAGKGTIMVVRMAGTAPVEVFTNPLKGDGDLDLLVDGDEQTFGTNPGNYNTDGDNQPDYSEVLTGRRPLVPDFAVNLTFGAIVVSVDGDEDDNRAQGDIIWNLGVAKPDGTRVPGSLFGSPASGHQQEREDGEEILLDNPFWCPWFKYDTLSCTLDIGLVSTTDALYEEFGITGFIQELDDGNTDCGIGFPGAALSDGDKPGTMPGRDLKAGVQSWSLHRKVACQSKDTFEITLYLSIRAS